MKTRIISGAILFAILIPTLILGGYVLLGVLCVVSLMGIYELLKVFDMSSSKLAFTSYIACIGFYALMAFMQSTYFIVMLVLFFLTMLLCYVYDYPKYKFHTAMVPMIAFLYAGVLISYIYRIRMLESGAYLVWIIFISSWLCDTCAYFSGVTLGKHKAFPILSPKKTWEGCIGGVLGSTIIAGIAGLLFKEQFTLFKYPALALVLICFFSSILSIVGDLAASAIKRENGIKDYSNLIPGHGGIMDRFDSVIYVSPVIFYLINVFSQYL